MAQNQLRNSCGTKCLANKSAKHESVKLQLPLASDVYSMAPHTKQNTNNSNITLSKDKTASRRVRTNPGPNINKPLSSVRRGVSSTQQLGFQNNRLRRGIVNTALIPQKQPPPAKQSQAQFIKLLRQQETQPAPIASKAHKTVPASKVEVLSYMPTEAKPNCADPKRSRSPVKAVDKTAKPDGRHTRNKHLTSSTKNYFDKYLKGAFDLSTPEGVRQLEAHFFPTVPETHGDSKKQQEAKEQGKQQANIKSLRKMGDKGNSNEEGATITAAQTSKGGAINKGQGVIESKC